MIFCILHFVSPSIFSIVEKWKKGRRLFNPAFNTTVLSRYFMDVFNKQNLELMSRMNKQIGTGKHFDLWPYFIERSVSTICGMYGRNKNIGYKWQKSKNGVLFHYVFFQKPHWIMMTWNMVIIYQNS